MLSREEIEEWKRIIKLNYDELKYAPEMIRNNPEIVKEAVKQNMLAFQYASKELKSNEKFLIEAIKNNGDLLRYASEDLRSNPEIVMEAVKQRGYALEYASEDLRSNPEIVMEAVKQNGSALECASEDLRSNPEIVMEAVKQHGYALKYASEDLRSNPEIVMEAVKQNGHALECASEDLRSNPEIVMEAVKQSGYALKYASEDLRNNPEIVMEAVKQYGYALEYASEELRNNFEIVKEAVKYDFRLLRYSSEKLSNNPEILKEAIKQSYIALWYASEDLRSDPKFIKEVARINGKVLEYLPEELKNNPEIIIEVVKNDLSILENASDEIRNNPQIIIEALKQDGKALEYASDELKNNPNLIVDEFKQDKNINGAYYCFNNVCPVAYSYLHPYYDDEFELSDEEERRGIIYADLSELLAEFLGFSNLDQYFMNEQLIVDIIEKIAETKTVVTHYGDDLDNKTSIYILEELARKCGEIGEKEHLTVERVPAGKIKEGYLNVDTGGHKGSRYGNDTLVIDGNPSEGIHSAAAELSELGIYVPKQIVELADVVPNKVSALDSRTALSLIRSANGEQIFEIAEDGLLDKALTDEQLEKYGLVQAHEKQQQIIDNAVEKVNKYSTELANGEKAVIAPEQILAGAQVAYELGANYYASIQAHKSGNGSTFAVTSKPGVQLPEEIKQFGQELVEKYKDPTDGTSGVFLNPNGQMLVAGGMKNPEFSVEYTPEELMEKLKSMFKTYEINGLRDTGYTPEEIEKALNLRKEDLEEILGETNERMSNKNQIGKESNQQEGQTQSDE